MLCADRLKNPLEIAQHRKRITDDLRIKNGKVENTIPNHETKWTNIKNVISSAAKNLKAKPNHNKEKHWFNNECMEAVKKRNETRIEMIHNQSQGNQERYKHFKKLANKTIRRHKRLYEKKSLEELEGDRNNPRKFFKHCKRLKRGFKPLTLFLKYDQNDLLSEPKDIIKHFRKHFDTLLNTSEINNGNGTKYEELIYQTAKPECREPDLTEIENIITNLKNNKAPGEDDINSELFKTAGKDILIEFQSLIREI